ncbi:MAG: MMPL family transporter [Planctomycetes bacterium]|nr:MMPL family transporter [Planctomycetota bacterium]
MSRLFAAFHNAIWRRPRLTVALLVASCVLAALAASRLRFSSDISKVLPADSPSVDAVSEVMKHFAFTGQLFIFFEKSDPAAPDAAAMRLADALGKRLSGAPEIVSAQWKMSPESEAFMADLVSQHGPLLLPDAEMDRFLARLEPAEIREVVQRGRRQLSRPGMGLTDALMKHDPLNLTRDFFLKRLGAGKPEGRVDVSSGYFFNEGRTALLMTVEGKEQPQNVAFSRRIVERVEGALAEARAEVPSAAGWKVTLLGGYPIALQSEASIKGDLKLNMLTSIPPVLIMLLISMRRWSSLAIGAVSLTVGTLWTFGLAGVAFGHLTAVTVGFAGLLAGMGIDITIHMFHRFRHERAAGLSAEAASLATFSGTGPGAFIAMVTTAFSILCLWVSGFRGLREFGTLVGVGVLLIFVSTFAAIPLFTRLERADRPGRDIPRWVLGTCWLLFAVYFAASVQLLSFLGIVIAVSCVVFMTAPGTRATINLIVGRPRLTAALAAAVTVASLAALARPPFGRLVPESDIRNLRSEDDTLLDAQERLRVAYAAGTESILVLVRAGSEDEALEKAALVSEALERIPGATTQSIANFVAPAARQERQARRLAAVDAARVVADLDRALDAEGFDPAAFDGAREWLRGLLAARTPVRPFALRDPFFLSIRNRFLARDDAGTVRSLVWFTPAGSLHTTPERNRAIAGLREAALRACPDAVLSGFPVVMQEIDARIGPDIFWSTLAGGAVSILLAWVLYGSFRWMAISILPAFVGTFWFIGILKLMGMHTNFINLIVFPILAGLATDNGLYLVERFREIRCRSVREAVTSLWPSLTLTSLTTIVGFGSLAFSTNRGMRSLGVAISVGMLCYLFASILILPPILWWLEKPGEEPVHVPESSS